MTAAQGVTMHGTRRTARGGIVASAIVLVLLALLMGGCVSRPTLLPPSQRQVIDRSVVEYPSGYNLELFAVNLNAPSGITFDEAGNMIIAEGGYEGIPPEIYGYRPDGTRFQIYPTGRRIPFLAEGFRIYGPIGGIAAYEGKVYVSHRDARRKGVITAFSYDGTHETIVGELPAQGDYSVTDLAIHEPNRELYFGVGAATNSGVVGLDNWEAGWVARDPKFCDVPLNDYRLTPARFTSPNPRAGLFGGGEIAVTSAFQPFGQASLRAQGSPVGRPTAAIYSVDLGGGGLRVFAHGIRHARGLAFNEFFNLYATNQGMELRGTRPVKDDPDALLHITRNSHYGWPDFSTTLEPITLEKFRPDDVRMLIKSGYPELSFLIDHSASGIYAPLRDTVLRGAFPALSGAAKLDFAPTEGPFSQFAGEAIVALSGDRAPFATSGRKLIGPVGRKVMRVNTEKRQVEEFIRNATGKPASEMKNAPLGALERPIDVKFGPNDAALYIVDLGVMRMRGGTEVVKRGTGKILRLVPARGQATTQPIDYVPAEPQGGFGNKPHLQDPPRRRN